LSVTLPSETYSSLERIARKKKVSLAWVVRDATEKYVSDELPLFREISNE
jgi:predicted transcriptional regulator